MSYAETDLDMKAKALGMCEQSQPNRTKTLAGTIPTCSPSSLNSSPTYVTFGNTNLQCSQGLNRRTSHNCEDNIIGVMLSST